MARARNIKPAFFQNEELAELEPIERLAFIGLWTIADYKGCLEYRAKRLKIQILPYDNCNIELIVNNLNKYGFIRVYSVQGQQYIKITNFEKHQNPHKNERESGSDIPDYDENNNEIIDLYQDGICTDKIGTNRADSLLLIPDSLKPLHASSEKKQSKYKPPISDELLKEWKQHRKGKPVTERVIKTIELEANKLGWTLTQAIEYCCSNSWQGFKAEWVNKPNKFDDRLAAANTAFGSIIRQDFMIEEKDITNESAPF